MTDITKELEEAAEVARENGHYKLTAGTIQRWAAEIARLSRHYEDRSGRGVWKEGVGYDEAVDAPVPADRPGRLAKVAEVVASGGYSLLKPNDSAPVPTDPEGDGTLLTWNVGQDDPHDYFPWTWTSDMEPNPNCLGSIETPNGPRPDGTMHTYRGVAYGIWEPNGRLICALVNRWAHEQFGTPLPPVVAAPAVPPAPGAPVPAETTPEDER